MIIKAREREQALILMVLGGSDYLRSPRWQWIEAKYFHSTNGLAKFAKKIGSRLFFIVLLGSKIVTLY
jgi:hypothetical protein